MDKEGHLVPRFKIRTKRKVIKAIVDKMEEYAQAALNIRANAISPTPIAMKMPRKWPGLLKSGFQS